jgi:ABC-type antimicrobial peptide transport system permease subunit
MGGVDGVVGTTLRFGRAELPVVGVVENTRMGGPTGDRRYDHQIYQSIYQTRPRLVSMSIMVRGDTAAAIPALHRRLVELAPTSAIDIVDDARSVIAFSYRRARFFALLLSAFMLSALTLASVGLYAMLANQVSRSMVEIGVRKSFGATATSIRMLTLRRGLVIAAAGIAAGMLLSLAAARALRGLLYEVAPLDAAAFAAGAIVIVVVAVAASLIPARRAAAIEPTEAFRRG